MKKSTILISFLTSAVLAQSPPYNILNQQPVANRPYPIAYYNHKLPNAGSGGPLNHLMTNSDSMMAAIMQNGAATDAGAWNSPGSDDGQHKPLYYGQSTDAVYQLAGCVSPMTSLNGIKFHAPSGAQFNQGSFDKEILFWDQTNNQTVGLFGGTCTAPNCFALPACSGTLSSPCSFTVNGGYCSADIWVSGSGIGGGNAVSTAGISPMGNIIRLTEIVNVHHINHGLRIVDLCSGTNGGLYTNRVVFPANQPGGTGANPCTATGTAEPRPPNGSLIFADYTQAQLDCFDPSKAACSGVSKLPVVQFALVEALTLYGGTTEDTGGGESIRVPGIESEQAYYFYNTHGYSGSLAVAQAFETYMGTSTGSGQCGSPWCTVTNRSSPHSVYQWNLTWAGIPSQGGKAFWQHLHIADQCVAIGLQGLTSSGGVAACTSVPPPPTSADYYVSTSGNDANSGTQASPWKTIQHAISSFTLGTSGTIIHVAQGTYSYPGGQACFQGQQPSICVSRGGSSPSIQLVLQCDSQWTVPSSSAGCHLSQSSVVGEGAIISLGNVNFVTIRGFEFTGSATGVGVIAGCDGNNPTTHTGVCPAGNGLIVEGNYFHDMGQTSDGGASSPGGIGCPSVGVVTAGPSHGVNAYYSAPPIARNNRIQHIGNLALGRKNGGTCNQYHGVYFSTPGAVIENNLILDVVAYGVHSYSYPCSGVITNNTIVRSGNSGITYSGYDCATVTGTSLAGSSGKGSLMNNILIDSGVSGMEFYSDGACVVATPNRLANNITNGLAFGYATSCDQQSGNLTSTGSALFVNYLGSASTANGNDDLHLKSGSPGIAAGTTTCVSAGLTPCVRTTDFSGNTMSSPPPIGAYTFSGAPSSGFSDNFNTGILDATKWLIDTGASPAPGGGNTGLFSVAPNVDLTQGVLALELGQVLHYSDITWIASTSTGVTGYNVKRGTVSGGPYTKLNNSPVTGLKYLDFSSAIQTPGGNFYYIVTSLSSAGESVPSNEIHVVVPANAGIYSIGAEVRSLVTYGYGTYSCTMRASSIATTPNGAGSQQTGSVSSCFSFVNNSQTEIDSPEFEGQGSPGLTGCTIGTVCAEFTNFNGIANHTNVNSVVATGDTAFHTYTWIWSPGSVQYLVDGSSVGTITTNVPSAPAYIIFNHYGTNSASFGGTATTGANSTRWQYISNFTYSPNINVAPILGLTPSSWDFGSIIIPGSASHVFTIANTGGAAASGVTYKFTGTASGDYSSTTTCGAQPFTLAAGGSCTITASCAPSQTGSRPGNLTVTYSGGTPTSVLSCTGTNVIPPPPSGLNVTVSGLVEKIP